MGSEMMEGMNMAPACGLYFGMWIWFLLITVIAVLLIWTVQKSGKSETPASRESALDILKKRYAKGEIDKEEFEEKKKSIQ